MSKLIEQIAMSDEAWVAIHTRPNDEVFHPTKALERYRNDNCRFEYVRDIKVIYLFVTIDDDNKSLIGTLRQGQSFKWNSAFVYRNEVILRCVRDGIKEMEQELLNG